MQKTEAHNATHTQTGKAHRQTDRQPDGRTDRQVQAMTDGHGQSGM